MDSFIRGNRRNTLKYERSFDFIFQVTRMNENLTVQLDQLRENYVQQRKIAASLLATLKSVTNTHTKTARLLRDYATQNSGITDGKLEQAQAALVGSRLKDEAVDPLLPDLRREIKVLASLIKALQDGAAALRSDPVDVVKLDHALGALEAGGQAAVAALLPELNEELTVAQRVLGDEFGQALRAALAGQGISVIGQPPRFEIGRFGIEANFGKRFAIVRYGNDVVMPHVPLTTEAVVKAYQSALKTITGRSEEGIKWMTQFYDAYQLARRKREISGTRVNVVDCYVEMSILRQGRTFFVEPSRHSFSDYTRAQFIYDFYEFANRRRIKAQGQVVRAHSATRTQAENPARSLWIVEGDGLHDGRYISDVEFEEE